MMGKSGSNKKRENKEKRKESKGSAFASYDEFAHLLDADSDDENKAKSHAYLKKATAG